ncbi:response regulator transcription factor [Ktedonosporobacter rubrisoli]|uniref:Response regulator transcription factor n=1 Tax=Ktedonosporobacter rubrisoli TaxID=2509675 RepID=A0A4P6K358_KTERU|nr:LuxR C-terminal-related transcriptional regulator [Ktedonosporobacter rubrisoli]QBD82678.1 response regulator transcription factor [Ktedonosporobacter rubrisoli]
MVLAHLQKNGTDSSQCELVVKQAKRRWLDVLWEFARGLTRQEVAAKLCLSVKTVDTYKTALFRLCRKIWNIPSHEPLDYRFFYREFSQYRQEGLLGSRMPEKDPDDLMLCKQVMHRATPRRLDVLREFAKGLTREEVAAKLCLSPSTVDTHKTALFRLCREAWNLSSDKYMDYCFIQEKFADCFDDQE